MTGKSVSRRRRIVLVVGQKGGTGKSTLARALVDRCRRDRIPAAAYDADGSVGQLLQFYGTRTADGQLDIVQNPLQGIGYFDLRQERQRDMLLQGIETEAAVVIFDCPGGVLHELGRVVDVGGMSVRGLMEIYRDQGFDPTVVLVLTPMMASSRAVIHAIQLFGDGVDYIVVKNLAFGAADEFVLFDGYTDAAGTDAAGKMVGGKMVGGKGKKMVEERNGIVLAMPVLQASTYALIDLYNLTFDAARTDTRLHLADRCRAHRWIRAMDAEFDRASPALGLGAR
jgi:hypothetical protein